MISFWRRSLHTSKLNFMKWAEVSAVLRPFYLKVHPDMFMNFPTERQTNENSLKDLNSYLETLTKSQIPQNRQLKFFIKNETNNGELRQLKINLKSKGLVDTLKQILASVDLPIDGVSSKINGNTKKEFEEDEYGYRDANDWYWTLHSDDLYGFRGPVKEMGLIAYLDEYLEVALARSTAAQPMHEEVSRVERQVLTTFGLEKVTWDCGWGIAHYRADLLALLNLQEHHPEIREVLRGKNLVFGKWTGVSLEGHIILSSSEVRHNWLTFLRNLDEQMKFVEWVPYSEQRLSNVLHGIQICHKRLSGHTLASKYIVQVDKVTKAVQRWLWLNRFPLSFPNDLSPFTLVVENDAGPLMVSQCGEIIVPSSCPAELLIDFLVDNLQKAETALENHSKNILEEEELREQVVWKFGLAELSKDETISSQRVVHCLRHLLDNSEELSTRLKDCHLRVSNCYSVLQDGILCIPARWKL